MKFNVKEYNNQRKIKYTCKEKKKKKENAYF